MSGMSSVKPFGLKNVDSGGMPVYSIFGRWA